MCWLTKRLQPIFDLGYPGVMMLRGGGAGSHHVPPPQKKKVARQTNQIIKCAAHEDHNNSYNSLLIFLDLGAWEMEPAKITTFQRVSPFVFECCKNKLWLTPIAPRRSLEVKQTNKNTHAKVEHKHPRFPKPQFE